MTRVWIPRESDAGEAVQCGDMISVLPAHVGEVPADVDRRPVGGDFIHDAVGIGIPRKNVAGVRVERGQVGARNPGDGREASSRQDDVAHVLDVAHVVSGSGEPRLWDSRGAVDRRDSVLGLSSDGGKSAADVDQGPNGLDRPHRTIHIRVP